MVREHPRIALRATPVATLARPGARGDQRAPRIEPAAFARAPAGRRFAIYCRPFASTDSFMTSTPPGDEPRDRPPTDASLYALEKLAQAVDELATGTGNLSDRLYEAAYSSSASSPTRSRMSFATSSQGEGRSDPPDALSSPASVEQTLPEPHITKLSRPSAAAHCARRPG